MKQFITTVMLATLVFTGLGIVVEKAGASFKSDERALAILQRARQAIGGESAIGGVRSMTIVGKTTKTFEGDGVARTEQGDVEINFELPNKMSKSLRFGTPDGNPAVVDKRLDVIVMRNGDGNATWTPQSSDAIPGQKVETVIVRKQDESGKVITEDVKPMIIRKSADGSNATWTSEDGKTVNVEGKKIMLRTADGNAPVAEMHQQIELFRTTLSLLLTAPEGLDVSYTYAGEGNVDGFPVDIIDAQVAKSGIKLYIDRGTSLPRMISFQAIKPLMVFFRKSDDSKAPTNGETKTMVRKMEQPQLEEFQIKYSDYRSVGGVQLPFKWTQTVGGKADETVDITSYEVNPANIADKFKEMPQKFVVKVDDQK
ncbi:MAG TPA: hypothetical protein PKO33_08730 [Pyrinomonadaceae bacterium]|nr:hypothetical protein [Pyrinomonadaceae bacterium]